MAKVKHKQTKEVRNAVYAPHRGRMVYYVEVNGEMKPFPDKQFDKEFEIVNE